MSIADRLSDEIIESRMHTHHSYEIAEILTNSFEIVDEETDYDKDETTWTCVDNSKIILNESGWNTK